MAIPTNEQYASTSEMGIAQIPPNPEVGLDLLHEMKALYSGRSLTCSLGIDLSGPGSDPLFFA